MSNINRRDFLAAALAVGALAGSTFAGAREAHAMKCPRLPKPKRDRTRVPLHILSEKGDEVEGEIDLFTVELEKSAGQPKTVEFELFVDTYETGKSIRPLTDKLASFAMVDPDLHRPPILLVTWGKSLMFKAIMRELRVGFTMFLDDGTPVRAKPALTMETLSDCDPLAP